MKAKKMSPHQSCPKCRGKGIVIKDVLSGSTEDCPVCIPPMIVAEPAELSCEEAMLEHGRYIRHRILQQPILPPSPPPHPTATEVNEKQKAFEAKFRLQQRLIAGVLKNPPKIISDDLS